MDTVSKRSGGITCKIASEKNGANGVVGVISPNGIITAHSGLFKGRHNAKLTRREVCVDGRGTHAKIIVVIPSRGRAGTDISVSAFVLGTSQHFTVTWGFVIAPVSGSAAVAHGQEILVLVGQIVDIINGK